MKPSAGMRLGDKVELLRPLASGGMGRVWVGRHLGLDTEVAVKFVARADAGARHLERFKREANLAAKLKSPHVVRVFDYDVVGEAPYIVMELLEGESLAERLERGALSIPDTALLVAQVAVALEEAHGLDIVHRDVKPANIFLVESHYQLFAKLLDFGVAKQTSFAVKNVTSTGAVVGTPHYMSPEQLLSTKDVDRRADLWALAVVSYHALTGRTPFEGKTMAALSMAISRGHFAPVSASVARAGPELDTWFKLALCRNINGRWSTAAELAKTFGEAAMDRADRQESALVLRSVRPEQLAAATISVDVPSAHGEDSVETPRDLAHDATIASDDRSGAVVPARDPSPAWWLAAVALLAVVVLARNWGFWREGAANATPTSSTTASIEPSGLLLVDQPPAPHSAAPQSSVPETSAATQPSSAHQPPPERAPVPLPADRTALPTASHAAPIDCREPFIVDEHGDMHPRPECLK